MSSGTSQRPAIRIGSTASAPGPDEVTLACRGIERACQSSVKGPRISFRPERSEPLRVWISARIQDGARIDAPSQNHSPVPRQLRPDLATSLKNVTPAGWPVCSQANTTPNHDRPQLAPSLAHESTQMWLPSPCAMGNLRDLSVSIVPPLHSPGRLSARGPGSFV